MLMRAFTLFMSKQQQQNHRYLRTYCSWCMRKKGVVILHLASVEQLDVISRTNVWHLKCSNMLMESGSDNTEKRVHKFSAIVVDLVFIREVDSNKWLFSVRNACFCVCGMQLLVHTVDYGNQVITVCNTIFSCLINWFA